MPRFLAVLVLFVVGWAPVSGIALSLGDIDLKSALNQPFVAEIPVSTDSERDMAELMVGVASAATFDQYGLDRAAFLGDFKFEIIGAGANGVVRVTSVNPVVEPFVTLLLEVSWPQGRLLREYTVLLDPPVFAAEAVAPAVEAPKAGPATAPGPTRVVQPAAPRSAPPARQPAAAPASRAPAPSGDAYGPVQRNDTLWEIAGRYADSAGVNRNQMMLAIYRANPEAFVGNINRLKAGMILRVPSADELQRLDRGQATAEVRRHNEEWRGASGVETADAGTLRLVPPPDVDDDAEPVGTGTGTATGDGAAADLRERVSDLEEELAETQRLLELRDAELAAVQRQAGVADQEIIPGVDEQPLEEPVAEEPVIEEPVAEEPLAEQPTPPPVVSRPDVVTTQPAEEPSFIGGLLTNIWLYVGLGGLLILALFIVRRRSAEPDTPPWGRLDEEAQGEETAEATQQLSPMPAADETFVVEESLAERTDQDQAPYIPPEPADVTLGDDAFSTDQDIPETPLERTISTESPVNLDEADPIAEADFHMAYGLYDQAADLLSNSLSEEPDRKDLRLKLLEVYFIWENQGGFLREAQELQSRLDDPADPDWNKVLIMGKQICPDEDLFSATPSVAGAVSEMDFTLTDDTDAGEGDSIDFDFSDTTSDVDIALGDESGDLDLDLSADDLGVGETEEDALDFDISEAEEATLMEEESDLGDGPTMETPTIESPELDATMESPIAPPSDEATMESPTLETPTVESEALETTMETPTIESEALETTMETPTIETPVAGDWETDTESGGTDQTAEIELDDLGLDLSDLDQSTAAEGGEPVAEADEEEEVDASGANLAAETLQVEIDQLESLDDDTQRRKMPTSEEELADLVDVEATGEMPELGDTSEQPVFGDTVEQPEAGGIGDTAEQPGLAAAGGATAEALIEPGDTSAEVDFDIGDTYADGDDTTSVVPATATVGDGATMTEVGTKLDLARAYIDMGDPDGARSILNEVLEEATDDQRQQAQKLLDDLED